MIVWISTVSGAELERATADAFRAEHRADAEVIAALDRIADGAESASIGIGEHYALIDARAFDQAQAGLMVLATDWVETDEDIPVAGRAYGATCRVQFVADSPVDIGAVLLPDTLIATDEDGELVTDPAIRSLLLAALQIEADVEAQEMAEDAERDACEADDEDRGETRHYHQTCGAY